MLILRFPEESSSLSTINGELLGSALSGLDAVQFPNPNGSSTYINDNHQVYLRYSHDVIFLNSVPHDGDSFDSSKKVSITDFRMKIRPMWQKLQILSASRRLCKV